VKDKRLEAGSKTCPHPCHSRSVLAGISVRAAEAFKKIT